MLRYVSLIYWLSGCVLSSHLKYYSLLHIIVTFILISIYDSRVSFLFYHSLWSCQSSLLHTWCGDKAKYGMLQFSDTTTTPGYWSCDIVSCTVYGNIFVCAVQTPETSDAGSWVFAICEKIILQLFILLPIRLKKNFT